MTPMTVQSARPGTSSITGDTDTVDQPRRAAKRPTARPSSRRSRGGKAAGRRERAARGRSQGVEKRKAR